MKVLAGGSGRAACALPISGAEVVDVSGMKLCEAVCFVGGHGEIGGLLEGFGRGVDEGACGGIGKSGVCSSDLRRRGRRCERDEVVRSGMLCGWPRRNRWLARGLRAWRR